MSAADPKPGVFTGFSGEQGPGGFRAAFLREDLGPNGEASGAATKLMEGLKDVSAVSETPRTPSLRSGSLGATPVASRDSGGMPLPTADGFTGARRASASAADKATESRFEKTAALHPVEQGEPGPSLSGGEAAQAADTATGGLVPRIARDGGQALSAAGSAAGQPFAHGGPTPAMAPLTANRPGEARDGRPAKAEGGGSFATPVLPPLPAPGSKTGRATGNMTTRAIGANATRSKSPAASPQKAISQKRISIEAAAQVPPEAVGSPSLPAAAGQVQRVGPAAGGGAGSAAGAPPRSGAEAEPPSVAASRIRETIPTIPTIPKIQTAAASQDGKSGAEPVPETKGNTLTALSHGSTPAARHSAEAAAAGKLGSIAAVPPGTVLQPQRTDAGHASSSSVFSVSPHGKEVSPAPGAEAAASGRPQAQTSSIFPRMDAQEAIRVVQSSPQRLSVGVEDASLGWVEVRAHASDAQISAAVVTSSSAAHAIAAHFPGMREDLAAHQVRVDHLELQTFTSDSGRGGGGGSQREPGGRTETQTQTPSSAETTSRAPATDLDSDSLSYINVRV